MLVQLGLPEQPPATLIGFIGHGVRRLVSRAIAAAGGPGDEDALVDRALALFLACYDGHLLDTTVLYPGVLETIARLRAAGIVLAIATNKPRAMALAIADGLGFAADFARVLGGDSQPRHKPDPAIVDALVAASRIARVETLLVGDSVVDVATARAAGVAVCGVTWGLTPAAVLREAQPDYCIGAPAELLDVVR
jgi:phosphoglycolate phosphatase